MYWKEDLKSSIIKLDPDRSVTLIKTQALLTSASCRHQVNLTEDVVIMWETTGKWLPHTSGFWHMTMLSKCLSPVKKIYNDKVKVATKHNK